MPRALAGPGRVGYRGWVDPQLLRDRSGRSGRKLLLYGLPFVTVVIVSLALVTAGGPRPYRVARLWGGPTDGAALSLRVEVFEMVGDRAGGTQEKPVAGGAVRVHVVRPGYEGAHAVTLDTEGGGEVRFEAVPGSGRTEVEIEQAGVTLARGAIGLSTERWAGAARRRGGFTETSAGGLFVRVAPARGALAVPFEEELVAEVRRGEAPISGADIELRATGGRATPPRVTADAAGRARFRLKAEEHTLGVTLRVSDAGGGGEASFGLGVVPGALRARLDGRTLVVESPVPREVAYFALVTERERLLGGRLALTPDDQGGSSARFTLPAAVAPTHAVVASDRDLRSPSSIGWPLSPTVTPAMTFDAVEALLLDGRPRAALHEKLRRDRVRWVTAAFCAAALLVELALLIALTRSSDRHLDAHLARSGVGVNEAEKLAPKRSPAVVIALMLVALGFLVVALAGILRLD
jgi:hypothetical protein